MIVQRRYIRDIDVLRPCHTHAGMQDGVDGLGIHDHAPQLGIDVIALLGVGSGNTSHKN